MLLVLSAGTVHANNTRNKILIQTKTLIFLLPEHTGRMSGILNSVSAPYSPDVSAPCCLVPWAALEAIHIRSDQSVFLVHTLSGCQTAQKKKNGKKEVKEYSPKWDAEDE